MGDELVPFAQDAPASFPSLDLAVQRASHAEHIWPKVQRALRVIQDDIVLQQLVGGFELSRDHRRYAEEITALNSALNPRFVDNPEFNQLPPAMLNGVVELAYDELVGVSVVGPFWRDDEVTEILIDGWDSIAVERGGQLFRTPLKFRDLEHAQSVARQLALKVSDRALNPRTPLVTAELPGARVTFAIGSVVKSGISVSMRKFPPLLGMTELLERGALNAEMRDFLADCVRARANILVSGGTGTGKTTVVNALSEFVPDSERVITIEDAYELSLSNTHWVALQTKEAASADDDVRIGLADLLVNTLRMRPDRIIVGEVREPHGAHTMLQAANTGHDGTMTTIHANSADRALNFRLAGMVRTAGNVPPEVAAAEVASAINVVVQIVRERGRRFISEVSVVDVTGVDGALISTDTVFVGVMRTEKGSDTEPRPTFFNRGRVRADTVLAMKMREAGVHNNWVGPS
jgi:pilus assembly protein CpaF